MTFDEYFKAVNGKGIDFDGNYGVQCFDLVNDYAVKVLGCKPFIGNYAWEIYENFGAQPSMARFNKIANTPDFVPKKGDIIVWAKSLNGKAGHCGIATGDGNTTWFTAYEQNWTGRNDPCTIVKHDYSHVLGVLRPKEQASVKAKTAETVKIKGIDVSMHQGAIDFEKVKAAGIKFVIIRVNNWNGFKNCVEKDPYFEQNYKAAKAAGLDVGAYYYTWECSVSGAMRDAELCMNYIAGKKFEYPIYFDLEWNKAFQQGRTVCDGMVKAFCDALENNGYFAGLYISRSPLQTYISQDVANRYSLWIAEYNSTCNYNGTYGMWQYSSTGTVDGISGNVDMDYCYKDYPAQIKDAGLNGYSKQTASAFDRYFTEVNGKGIDFDGNYGVQCFDLVNDYAVKVLGCKPFIGNYAWEIYENFGAQPSMARFTKIANTPDFVPKKGDIVVWAKSLNGKAGHCGIATGDGDTTWFTAYEQNWTGRNDPCTIVKHDYSHVLGVLRPKEQSIVAGESLKPLDTDGFKKGDKSLGVLYLKQRLKNLGYNVDDTQGFGGGTEKAVNSLLKKWGYKQNGIAGAKFAEFVMR